ncbi:MAG TPA: membrane protein insertase YidC [Mycobacteriales bacterium]
MLNFLYIAVSWVLLRWHEAFTWLGMDPASGLTWALSIVFLVITIRLLLFRFFIKQVHSQRKMQEVQPKIAALREKYKNDRQTLSQEMMKLQKEEGFNPIGGCLPILMQAPVFISLFHVLRLIGTDKASALSGEYHWTAEQATLAGKATVFGAPIASAFSDPRNLVAQINGASATATHIVAAVLVVLMVAATYITQKQVMLRSTTTLDAQQAMIQKLMLYGIPASLLVSGFFFPIGVLFYWFTNNLWSMGQQFYILKRMPHPNAKDDGVSPEVAKALAPKPGQKPVRPKRTAAAVEAGDGTVIDGETYTPDGGATATTAKSPNGKAPTAKSPNGKTPNAKAPTGKAPDGTTPAADGATPDGPDADATAPAPAPRAKPGPGARPGGNGGRRPAGQRSPTQTRQKKKRR